MGDAPSDRKIPKPLIYLVGDVLAEWYYSHSALNTLFGQLGAPGDPPEGNCVTKCQAWLLRVNNSPDMDPIGFLGELLIDFMGKDLQGNIKWEKGVERIKIGLAKFGLGYDAKGRIVNLNPEPQITAFHEVEPAPGAQPCLPAPRISGVPEKRRFSVALSFPGEHRGYVEQVAIYLGHKLGREAVFYDGWHEEELARLNLDTYLMGLYHKHSHLIVIFLCAEYERKEWCKLEWRAVRDLMKQSRNEEIMLIRFDQTTVPGVLSIDGYIDGRTKSPAEVSSLILKRLNRLSILTSSFEADITPPPQNTAEENVLFECAQDGRLYIIETDAYGKWIRSGKKDFFDENDPAVQAKYMDSFESLVANGFVRRENGNAYRLTGSGFERARLIFEQRKSQN